MRISPGWMLACALVAIGGAVGGASIGTSPMIQQRGEIAQIPPQPIIRSAAHEPLPDHYALETPEGRFAVGELGLRGRLHDSHSAVQWERDRQLAEGGLVDYAPGRVDRDHARFAREQALIAYTVNREPAAQPAAAPARYERFDGAGQARPSRAEAPLALADPVAVAPRESVPVARIGSAKIIAISASPAD